uniref:TPR_REGION domain-containing protein n=1 Tax=Steinernema glaseri TaxID=37863 RepID=A0A1I7XVH0_9BILA
MDPQVELLRQFVAACEKDPNLLHEPKFAFYKAYLESLGATIPPKKEKAQEPAEEHAQEAEEDFGIPPPEIDATGVIPPDSGEALPMGDLNKQPSDDDLEKANEERNKATEAFSEGNLDAALQHFTSAIELNPGSAMLHAKRANVLLKLEKPVAAIRDCDKAISINPDSATAYKFRGRANRLLGNWLEAHNDLAMACKLDYDDVANEWLKEVEPNAKKIQEYNRAKARHVEEKALRERQERVRRAQEENRKAAEEQAKRDAEAGEMPNFPQGSGSEDIPSTPFGAEFVSQLLQDPELMKIMKEDPSLMAACMDIMQNPQNIEKYMQNPNLLKLLEKIGGKFGATPPGAAGGCPMGEQSSSQAPPHRAPEPDLD